MMGAEQFSELAIYVDMTGLMSSYAVFSVQGSTSLLMAEVSVQHLDCMISIFVGSNFVPKFLFVIWCMGLEVNVYAV